MLHVLIASLRFASEHAHYCICVIIIDVFYLQSTQPVKIGTWGGNGGGRVDLSVLPRSLKSVTIRSGAAIDAIAFTYIGTDGKEHLAGPWGGGGGNPTTVHII